MYVYLEKIDRNQASIRRATEARTAEMRERILAVDRLEQPGPSVLQYVSQSYARQTTEPDFVNLPDNQIIRQLSHIDREMNSVLQSREDRMLESNAEYHTIRCEINGGVVNMPMNLEDMRRAMGLPLYDLYSPFRPPVATQELAVNMEDEDHVQDNN